MMTTMNQRKLSIWLFVIYLLGLACIILLKFPFKFSNLDDIRAVQLIPFYVSEVKKASLFFGNIIYNVLLFIPFGVFVCLIKPDWTFVRRVIPTVLLSLSFEILQFIFAIGVSDTTDLVTNTAGGIMGIGLYHIMRATFKDRTHTVINTIALILVVIMLTLFCAVLVIMQH